MGRLAAAAAARLSLQQQPRPSHRSCWCTVYHCARGRLSCELAIAAWAMPLLHKEPGWR